jgi:glycosyltransferase involved in cell wall biosynthesis
MNILLAPTTYLPFASGVPIFVRQLADGYVGRGHHVVVIAPTLALGEPEVEVVNGVEIRRRPFVFPARIVWQQGAERLLPFCCRAPGDLWYLMRLVRTHRIELINIHSLTGSMFPYALLVAQLSNRPLIVTLHGHEYDRLESSAAPLRRRLLNHAFRQARQIITISAQLASETKRFNLATADKLLVVPNGVDLEGFGGAGPEGRFPYILSVGRLNCFKAHDLLLVAFQQVAEHDPDVRLVIAGDGPERIRLHAVSLALGLTHRVAFVGQVGREQVRELLAGCELFVLSSWSEGVPTVVLEAMASGKAVVGTRVGGVPEIIRDSETGLLVPPGNSDALAAAMLALLRNPARRAAMGAQGRAVVRANHDFAGTIERYLAIYRAAIQRSSSGRSRRREAEPARLREEQ